MGLKLEKYTRSFTFVPVVIDSRSITAIVPHIKPDNGCHIFIGGQEMWVKGTLDELIKKIEEDLKDHDGYKISNVVQIGQP
jgi:predicted metal-dependent hydrolase